MSVGYLLSLNNNGNVGTIKMHQLSFLIFDENSLGPTCWFIFTLKYLFMNLHYKFKQKSDVTHLPILSTSSISTRGFSVFVFLRHCINFPGIAPTQVLRWPLISATSVIPPTLNLKYCNKKQHRQLHAQKQQYQIRH